MPAGMLQAPQQAISILADCAPSGKAGRATPQGEVQVPLRNLAIKIAAKGLRAAKSAFAD